MTRLAVGAGGEPGRRPAVPTETVPEERVRLEKETVTDQQTVSGEGRKERVDVEGETADRRNRR
jgi:hypothetical protein